MRLGIRHVWLDAAKGLLYGASGSRSGPGAHNVGGATRGMWVARVGKGAVRPAIAYRKDTGAVAWTYGQRSTTNSTPALAKINGRDQLVHLDKGRLFGIDAKTGEEVWTFSAPELTKNEGGPIPTPTVDGNIVFSGSVGCPMVARGKLYIHYSDRLTCYDLMSP